MNEANPVRGMRPHTNPNTNARAWRIQWMTSCSSPCFFCHRGQHRIVGFRRCFRGVYFSSLWIVPRTSVQLSSLSISFFVRLLERFVSGMSSYLLPCVFRSDPIARSVSFLGCVCFVPLRYLRRVFLGTRDDGWTQHDGSNPTSPSKPFGSKIPSFPINPSKETRCLSLLPVAPRRPWTVDHRWWTDGLCGLSMGDTDPWISAVQLARPSRVWCTNTRHTCVERHGRCIDRDEWTGCTRAGRRNGRNARDPTEDGCVTHENADRPRRVGSEKHHITMERKRKTNTNHTMDNSHVDAQAKRSRRTTS